MEILLSEEFRGKFSCLDKQTQKRADKQITVFKNSPFYPSLHTEKLAPKAKEVWSFRIDKKYRIIFKFLSNGRVLFLTVGPHDWIYKIEF